MEFLNNLFDTLGPLGPYIKGLLILIIGWIIAKFIRKGVAMGLSKTGIDEKAAKFLGKNEAGASAGFATFVFGLIMLLVVVAALEAIGLTEVTEPLKDLVGKIFRAIPNIIAAAIIMVFAVFLGKIAKMLLSNIMGAARVDQRLGNTASTPIQTGVSTGVFWLIILLFLPGALNKLAMPDVAAPVNGVVQDILGYAPKLLIGGIIFAIGFLIARIVQQLLHNVLNAVKFDELPSKMGFQASAITGSKSPSLVVSYVAMAAILVITGTQALQKMELGMISDMGQGLVGLFFNLLGALIIMLVGILIANFVHRILSPRNQVMGTIAKIVVLFVAGTMALNVANIAPEISSMAYQVILISLGVAVGIGGAIALGLGGKASVAKFLERHL